MGHLNPEAMRLLQGLFIALLMFITAEDDLFVLAGRRPARMTTTGSFTLSSEGGHGRRGRGGRRGRNAQQQQQRNGPAARAGPGEELKDGMDDLDDAPELLDSANQAQINQWDLSNGGECDESKEAWVSTDSTDHTMGKCVEYASSTSCSPQCFHQGSQVEESNENAVCTKICRMQGPKGASCNVIKRVKPQIETSELGESKTVYVTQSKVMEAGVKKENLHLADPYACSTIAHNRRIE